MHDSRVLLLLIDSGFEDVETRVKESARKNALSHSYLAVVKPIVPNDLPRMFGDGSFIAQSLFKGYHAFEVYYFSRKI